MAEISEEVKKAAFEMTGQLSIYHIQQVVEIINLASTRGAFKASELSLVGGIYDILSGGVQKAVIKASQDIEKKKEFVILNKKTINTDPKVIKEETAEEITEESV